MEKLTPRQEEYLLLFAARNGRDNTVSEAAQRFGVSKATVSVVCAALTKYGMIQRSEQGETSLTPQGWAYIGEKLKTTRAVATCLATRLGLQPYTAEMEARRMTVSLEPETISAMLRSWHYRDGPTPFDSGIPTDLHVKDITTPRPQPDPELPKLSPGIYSVPFEVRKASRRELSMGDQGFLKPARLFCQKDGKWTLVLRTANFSYRPNHHKQMDGGLERLWYQTAGAWFESQATAENGFTIPADVLRCHHGPEGLVGTVRIRARATVGLRKMPESEADLVFLLEGLEQHT